MRTIKQRGEGPAADWRAAVSLARGMVSGQGPVSTGPEVVATIVAIMRGNPDTTFREIQAQVKGRHGVRLTHATVGNIMRRHGLQCGRGSRRLREMEERLLAGKPVSGWFHNKLLEANPALRERERETAGPGERVCVTFFPVATPAGKVFAHVAVDTFGGMAVAEFYRKGTTEAAVDFLHGRVLPFYRREGFLMRAVETNRNTVYYGGGETHVCGVYLKLQGIGHEVRPVAMPAMNGFMEKFKQAFTSGFVQPLRLGRWRGRGRESRPLTEPALTGLREELAKWLFHYNGEEPQEGYRNAGRTPRACWQERRKTLNVEH
ncbi:integrase family protein [Opitutaceae bacterium TAV1]|nr:integrase family protein [Opitutaceae bacterium TAV1]